MAIITIQWNSECLGKCTKTNVYVNDRAEPPYPAYYLLHGLSDDETKWLRGTRLEDHAAPWPFMIVMPDGERSFYCDTPAGAFESLVAKELVARIDALFPTRRDPGARAVGGLSMGGYGALKLALKHPDVFGVGASHSGAVAFGEEEAEGRWNSLEPLLGAAFRDPASNVFKLAAASDPSRRPALSVDCGVDDFLIESNRAFHAHLKRLGYAHHYAEHPGAHTWGYWNDRLPEALAFAARALGIEPLA